MTTLEELKQEIFNEAQNAIEIAEKDFNAGKADCKTGIYDKWYRYNHKDDGRAYDLGWMWQNKETKNDKVRFINGF